MRHLLSFLLALFLTPLIYIAAGYSAVKFADANTATGVHPQAAGLGLIGALVAGGLYSLLVMARLSPLGPVFAGLCYVGVTLWAVLDMASFVDLMPADLFGVHNLLHTPVGPGTALLAVPLLFTIFSPRRWRRTVAPAAAGNQVTPTYPAAPTYPGAPGSAAPMYDDTTIAATPTYPAPTYTPPSYGETSYEPPVYTPAAYTAPAPSAPRVPMTPGAGEPDTIPPR